MTSPMRRMRSLFTRAGKPQRSVSAGADAAAYFAALERDTETWLALGAKLLSHDAVNGLVLHASQGSVGWDALVIAVQTQRKWRPRAGWNGEQLVAAAALSCVITPEPEMYGTAAKILDGVLATSSPEQWAPELRMLCYQAATLAERRDVLERLIPHCQKLSGLTWVTQTDLVRPQSDDLGINAVGALTEATERWWRVFNEPFVNDGLEPWELRPQTGTGHMFAWIHAPHVEGCSIPADEQPLVSVVVPVYNPDSGFLNTIESLTRQSWRNLEIVIVDDASTQGREIIERAEGLDPRITLTTLERNSGAYAARNAGFEVSRGEFVTVLDADDLSHSRRIELQTTALLEQPQKMASGIAGIRMFADGALTMYGFHTRRRNYSAFLFRRVPVMEALGRFDDVRKSGDIEFHERLQARFGSTAIVPVRKHLSITQLTPGSLSRNDSRYVWLAGERLAYLNQYRGWHRSAVEQGDTTELRLSGNVRPFVAPARFLGDDPPVDFGYALLRDWTEEIDGGELPQLMRRIPEGHRYGVGLVSGVHPRRSAASRGAVHPDTWRAVETGAATWLPWARDASIGTLIVTDPEYLCALPDREFSGLRVRNVMILSCPPFEMKGTDAALLDRGWIADRCSEFFGCGVEWVD